MHIGTLLSGKPRVSPSERLDLNVSRHGRSAITLDLPYTKIPLAVKVADLFGQSIPFEINSPVQSGDDGTDDTFDHKLGPPLSGKPHVMTEGHILQMSACKQRRRHSRI